MDNKRKGNDGFVMDSCIAVPKKYVYAGELIKIGNFEFLKISFDVRIKFFWVERTSQSDERQNFWN